MTQQQQTTAPKAVTDADLANIVGMSRDEREINRRLTWAARECFLVSPSTVCSLQPGCAVSFAALWVDPKNDSHDVGAGKRGLLGTTLLRLANAAGISWDAHRSGRMDPGNSPHIVHWHAAGAWRGLDGTVLSVPGDLQMDLSNDSDQTRKVMESAKAKTKWTNGREEIIVPAAEVGRIQLRDTRAKILEHAQKKAELRAIRQALALRSYTEAELLTKPFIVARLVFTGHDVDPEVERANKAAIRANMLGGSQALFGAPPVHHALPSAPMPFRLSPAPSATIDGEILDDVEPELRRTPPPPPPTPTPKPTESYPEPNGSGVPPAAPAHPPAGAAGPARSGQPSGFTIPGGRSKGCPIEDADDQDLRFWIGRITDGLDRPDNAKFRDRNVSQVAAMQAELSYRQQGSLGGGHVDDDQIPH